MDNALRAVAESEEHTASFQLRIDDETIRIHGENVIPSMQTGIKREGHGYGTTIIREIVRKYNGKYTVLQTNPIYQTDVEIRNRT